MDPLSMDFWIKKVVCPSGLWCWFRRFILKGYINLLHQLVWSTGKGLSAAESRSVWEVSVDLSSFFYF